MSFADVLRRDPDHGGAREALGQLGPAGAAVLQRIERQARPLRLAGIDWDLWLDGHGAQANSPPSERERHPYLGAPPFNVGDQFVALALARVMRVSEFCTVGARAAAIDFERVNRECDAFLIRGSCFLYPGFFERHLGMDVLEKIHIPILFVGAGVQFDLNEPMHLLRSDVECLKRIHDSCVSTSVRGPRSAELLAGYGIRNVRVTGCPTIVWSLKRDVAVGAPSLERAAWTITDLSWSPAAELAQFRHMRRLHEAAARVHFVAQGGEVVLQRWLAHRQHLHHGNRRDVPESAFLVRSTYEATDAPAALGDLAYRYRHWPSNMLDTLQEDGFFAQHVHEYLRFLREMTLVCGTRLHGNMMALVQGVPTVFCVHDRRVAEMVELMRAPSFVLGEDERFDPARWDWTPFERQYPAIHDGFVAYFEENGLPHNLGREGAWEALDRAGETYR